MSAKRTLAILLLLLPLACAKESGENRVRHKGTMTLTLSSGQKIPNPTDDEIRQALNALNVQADGEGFAILKREEMTYLQVSGDKQIGFDMEYQEGDAEKHYRADREDFSLEEVARAFMAYRDEEIDWKQYGDWSRISW